MHFIRAYWLVNRKLELNNLVIPYPEEALRLSFFFFEMFWNGWKRLLVFFDRYTSRDSKLETQLNQLKTTSRKPSAYSIILTSHSLQTSFQLFWFTTWKDIWVEWVLRIISNLASSLHSNNCNAYPGLHYTTNHIIWKKSVIIFSPPPIRHIAFTSPVKTYTVFTPAVNSTANIITFAHLVRAVKLHLAISPLNKVITHA